LERGPVFPAGVGDGSTLRIDVLGISNHCPTESALTQAGSVARGGGGAEAVVEVAVFE
jgi:hypothetical protein